MQSQWKVTETSDFAGHIGKWAYLMPEKFQYKITNMVLIPRLEQEIATCASISNFDWVLNWSVDRGGILDFL